MSVERGTGRGEDRRPWDGPARALQSLGGPQRTVSVLFPDVALADGADGGRTDGTGTGGAAEPACFADLDLDQIADAIEAGREQYHLRPYLYQPLVDSDSVTYRQQVFADLDGSQLAQDTSDFCARMRSMRELLGEATKTQHRYQIRSWMLSAASAYVEAVTSLLDRLDAASLSSRAMLEFRGGLRDYVGSDGFQALHQDMLTARDALSGVRYTLLFYANVIRVRRLQDEVDYGAEISSFFERFRQDDGGAGSSDRPEPKVRNRLEDRVLDQVVTLFPEAFAAMDRFCDAHHAWLDGMVGRFEREVQFYLAWLELLSRLREKALPVCFPTVSSTARSEAASSTYDLALALRIMSGSDAGVEVAELVTNDYRLSARERTMVVTGPNQGGKTTFGRAIGQIHWLASLGCPVPAARARLRLTDGVFTHFERAENIEDMRGKLADDLVRIHAILGRVSERSVVILNEVFASTTLRDATSLSRMILSSLSQLDALVVCVTFIDELSRFDPRTVSMVAGVDPDDPTVRTFRLERRPADGRAYAVLLADRYGLSRQKVQERVSQ